MKSPETIFAMPTYNRWGETPAVVVEWAKNLVDHGHHDVPMMVFDDTPYHAQSAIELDKIDPRISVHYIGWEEKQRFLGYIFQELQAAGTPKHEVIVLQEFFGKASYGENRLQILLHTGGNLVVCMDDDIHPFGFLIYPEKCQEFFGQNPKLFDGSPSERKIWSSHSGVRIKYPPELFTKPGGYFLTGKMIEGLCAKVTQDIVGIYSQYLGKKTTELPPMVGFGETLYEGRTESLSRACRADGFDPSATYAPSVIGSNAPIGQVSFAQGYLEGDVDLNASDLARAITADSQNRNVDNPIRVRYILTPGGFPPLVVSHDSHLACGILGIDNSLGAPPFLPTSLRCEDSAQKVFLKQIEGSLIARVPAIIYHRKSGVERLNVPKTLFSELMGKILVGKFGLLVNYQLVDGVWTYQTSGGIPAVHKSDIDPITQQVCGQIAKAYGFVGVGHEEYYQYARELGELFAVHSRSDFQAKVASLVNKEWEKIVILGKNWPLLWKISKQAIQRMEYLNKPINCQKTY